MTLYSYLPVNGDKVWVQKVWMERVNDSKGSVVKQRWDSDACQMFGWFFWMKEEGFCVWNVAGNIMWSLKSVWFLFVLCVAFTCSLRCISTGWLLLVKLSIRCVWGVVCMCVSAHHKTVQDEKNSWMDPDAGEMRSKLLLFLMTTEVESLWDRPAHSRFVIDDQ